MPAMVIMSKQKTRMTLHIDIFQFERTATLHSNMRNQQCDEVNLRRGAFTAEIDEFNFLLPVRFDFLAWSLSLRHVMFLTSEVLFPFY
jgi:hypothetical protein